MYLYPHKADWANEFARESEIIANGFDLKLTLHHIGSTAIEGLFAKNCIDILGVVPNLIDVINNKQKLIKMGYRYKGSYGIEGRAYFSKENRKIHLHVFNQGDINIEKYLNFIRIMKNNNPLIQELNQIKSMLHKKYPMDKNAYQRDKKFFYDKIEQMTISNIA